MKSRLVLRTLVASALFVTGFDRANASFIVGVDSTTDSTTFTLAGDASSRQGLSTLGITNSGGSAPDLVGQTLTAQTRYASVAVADNGNGGNALDSARVNTDYTVVFSVTAISGSIYTVDIATSLAGALTLFDDYNIGNGTSGQSTISNLTGSLGGVGNAALGLSSATNSPNGTSGSSNTPLSFSNLLNLGPQVGTGAAQNYTLRFIFNTFAESRATSSTFDNADEAAARLGMTGTINGGGGTFEQVANNIQADDYPGQGSRTIGNDGHFVTFTATYTAVPEASSLVLAGIALAGLLVTARRGKRV